jgi:hypothetical protein
MQAIADPAAFIRCAEITATTYASAALGVCWHALSRFGATVQGDLNRLAADQLNQRRRKTLGRRTPAKKMRDLLDQDPA